MLQTSHAWSNQVCHTCMVTKGTTWATCMVTKEDNMGYLVQAWAPFVRMQPCESTSHSKRPINTKVCHALLPCKSTQETLLQNSIPSKTITSPSLSNPTLFPPPTAPTPTHGPHPPLPLTHGPH